MKIMSILTEKSVSVKLAKASSLLAFFALTTACSNYTAQPLCSDANAVLPPGLTGTYTMTLQGEDFSTSTQEWTVTYDEQAKKISFADEKGKGEDGSLCSVNGVLIQESLNEDLGVYEQSRLVVSGFGLTIAPVFFDINELEAAGIAAKIVEVPAKLRKIATSFVSSVMEKGVRSSLLQLLDGEEPVVAMVVQNDDVDARAVVSTMKTGPVSLNFIRK